MPWDVTTAIYTGKKTRVNGTDNNPNTMAFSVDGTKFYILGTSNETVFQYELSVAGDISSASYSGKSKSIIAEDTGPVYNIAFSFDGTKMYMSGFQNKTVYQYALSIPWEVDTAIYTGKSKLVTAQVSNPFAINFSIDGTKMYILDGAGQVIYQYALSIPWDVDTAIYDNKSKSVISEDTSAQDIALSDDGTRMYMIGATNRTVYQYALSVAGDISSAVYINKSKDVFLDVSLPFGISFNTDGTDMFTFGATNETIYQWALRAAAVTVSIPLFENLIKRLLPTGRAWRQITAIKVVTDFLGGIADALEEVKTAAEKVRDSIFPELMDAEFIPDWEQRFKLPPIANGTEQERRDRLASQWQNKGGLTRQFLEERLQESGFDVFVYEGLYIAEGSVLDDVILGDAVLEGDVVPGEILAINPCDQFAGNVGTLGDYVLGDGDTLGVNRPRIIQNYIDEALENTDFCPIDPGRYNFVIYIGGPGGIGDIADIPASRYDEFRETVLKYKRGTSWALAFVNLV